MDPLPLVVPRWDVVLYSVRVNQQRSGDAYLQRSPDGRLFAHRRDLEGWRLRLPASGRAVAIRGEEHFPLDDFEGIVLEVDGPRQELNLDIPPRHFLETQVDGTPVRFASPQPPGFGGFGNYDLFYGATPDRRRLDGQFEVGLFNFMGVGTSGFLARDIGARMRGVRLDTTWTRDFPEEARTLAVGDTVGAGGIWGRSVRYGGVRYGTNFATIPGFATLPLPSVRGESALPTTAELYIDGVLRQSASLSPGPFRLDNLPVVSGQSDVRLVVRDIMGREQVITQTFYASSQLLRQGLSDDSYEIGAERRNFGTRSNDYGRFLAVAQRRRGFSDAFTGEARVEVLHDQQTAGLGGSVALTNVGVFTGALALSRSAQGGGSLASLAFERNVHRGLSLGLRSQWTSENFRELGLPSGQPSPRILMGGTIGLSAGEYGSLGFAYARRDDRNGSDIRVASATYSVDVAGWASLVLSALTSLAEERTQSFSMTISFRLGERSSASVGHSGQSHARQTIVRAQQYLPPGSGVGYRVLAGNDGMGSRAEVGLSMQTDSGTYMAEVGRASSLTAYRASASGGIGLLDGRVFLSRRLNEGFGMVQVPGFRNVGIYLNNQIVARTDADGYAVLPSLLAYQANPIRIEIEDLPLDAQIEMATADAVPYFRSGTSIRFPVQLSRGALIAVLLEDGTPMPPGSLVRIVGKEGEFPVAQRGEAYVVGLAEWNRLTLTWHGQSCEVIVELGHGAGPLPRIGPLTCRGVSR